jgi:hypothetical protein
LYSLCYHGSFSPLFACRSILVAESYSDNKLSFVEDALLPGEGSRAGRTNSETWEPLEKLSKGEVRCFLRVALVMLSNGASSAASCERRWW